MFGALVPAYLFCAGAGAGACFVLATMGLQVPRECICVVRATPAARGVRGAFVAGEAYRKLFGPGFAVAFVALAVGALLLASDAGTAFAPAMLLLNPTATYLSFGSYALVAGLVLAAFLFVCWYMANTGVSYVAVRVAQWLMVFVSVGIAVYTGLLLSSMPAVPIWFTPWLLVLFVASSLSCGCALAIASALLAGALDSFKATVVRMAFIDLAIIAVEVLATIAFLVTAFSNPYDVAVQGATSLLSGVLHELFLFGFVCVGLVAPAALELAVVIRGRAVPSVLLGISASVLAGGMILRYCIVMVGSHPEVWAVIA